LVQKSLFIKTYALKALKISALITGAVILGGLAFLLITSMKAPEQFLQNFREETARIGNNKVILAYPDDLLEKRTRLDARLTMSEDDSIGLRINLNDKALYLETKGIVLQKTPILEFKTSAFFRKLNAAEKYVLFHKPMAIQRDESTIEKDRFEVVIAPKDTIEAQSRPEIIPDTVLHEPVQYRLYFNNGIRVQVTGILHDSIPQFWPRFHFNYADRSKFLKDLLHSITNKSEVPYHPTLSIVIEARDAEAIYRAIPKKGNVILEL
jgi:hypothetical protein